LRLIYHTFSYFGYDEFKANAFKVTKDAEFDWIMTLELLMPKRLKKALNLEEKENQQGLFLIKIWTNLW
jgi:hypothetical protein